MFESMKSVFKRLSKKLTIPAAAFGAIGVSTTLACCYGPAPEYPVADFETEDACEKMLCECAKAHGLWSDECTTSAMDSCGRTLYYRAGSARDKAPASLDSKGYLAYLLGLVERKEMTPSAALEAVIDTWRDCTISSASAPDSCEKYLKISDVVQNAPFKDKHVRWVAAKYALSMGSVAVIARGYELAAAAIEADVDVDQSIAKVLEQLGTTKFRDYALRVGLESFGAAVIENAKRVKAGGDAAQIEAATANLQKLASIAEAAKSNHFEEVQNAAAGVIEQLKAFEQ